VSAAPGIGVRLGDWPTLGTVAAPVRIAVFVREQGFPADEEFDDDDPRALHAVADVGGAAVGTGRLLPDGRIGRMAVIASARGAGVGAAILQALIDAARERGDAAVVLSAQVSAVGFYLRHGFEPQGGVYDDTGVPHRAMRRTLR
jgi:predicted GNAT family N-acyltransferase